MLLWQIAIPNQLGEVETRYGLHMLSPSIDVPSVQAETTEMIQYELVYPSVVEHKFPKILLLPVELKLFNRTNEQVHIQLQLIR